MIITQSSSTLSSLFFFFKPASQRAAPAFTHPPITHCAQRAPALPAPPAPPPAALLPKSPKPQTIHHPLSTIHPLHSLSYSLLLSSLFLVRIFTASFSPFVIFWIPTIYRLLQNLLHRLHRALALPSTNIRNNRELDAPIHANQTPFSQRKPLVKTLRQSTIDHCERLPYTPCHLCRYPIPNTLGRANTPPQPPQATLAVLCFQSPFQHLFRPYRHYRKRACPALLVGRIDKEHTIIPSLQTRTSLQQGIVPAVDATLKTPPGFTTTSMT